MVLLLCKNRIVHSLKIVLKSMPLNFVNIILMFVKPQITLEYNESKKTI